MVGLLQYCTMMHTDSAWAHMHVRISSTASVILVVSVCQNTINSDFISSCRFWFEKRKTTQLAAAFSFTVIQLLHKLVLLFVLRW